MVIMIHGFFKLLVCVSTALSLMLALTVSVFAQSHTTSPAPMMVEQPCTDHHEPRGVNTWAEACASLCESADFHIVLGNAPERLQGPDLAIESVTYTGVATLNLADLYSSNSVNGHDPPRSRLYLTTHRLRI